MFPTPRARSSSNRGTASSSTRTGVPEAENSREELFENHRLEEALGAVADRSPEEINRAVVEAVRKFCGGEPQSDDITCLTLAYHG